MSRPALSSLQYSLLIEAVNNDRIPTLRSWSSKHYSLLNLVFEGYFTVKDSDCGRFSWFTITDTGRARIEA